MPDPPQPSHDVIRRAIKLLGWGAKGGFFATVVDAERKGCSTEPMFQYWDTLRAAPIPVNDDIASFILTAAMVEKCIRNGGMIHGSGMQNEKVIVVTPCKDDEDKDFDTTAPTLLEALVLAFEAVNKVAVNET